MQGATSHFVYVPSPQMVVDLAAAGRGNVQSPEAGTTGGTKPGLDRVRSHRVAGNDCAKVKARLEEEKIDFVVVGPEAPLVAGLVDRLEAAGIKAFGPSAGAAELEGSKGFMKDICRKYGVPTAEYRRFTDAAAAKAYIQERDAPIVVKADGLAAGKGVVVAQSVTEALEAVDDMMVARRFGGAGAELVVEDCLIGEEASFLALVDGETALPLASAQDHKAVGEGDTGPNTGGMGAYSPAPVVTQALVDEVMERVIRPTVRGLAAEGRPFCLLYTSPSPRD